MKPIVVAAALVILCSDYVYSQTADFNALAKTGTFQQIQAAIKRGADIKA